uniref:Uncharacterized protein n=1 Tax=Micrurus corallinus TaxID=54390 RepID=A0A2D4G0J5_MICCO
MFITEKSNTTIKYANHAFHIISNPGNHGEENISKNHGEMKAEMEEVKREVKSDIQKLDERMGSIQDAIQKNDQRIKAIEKRTEQKEKKIDLVDQRMIGLNKDLEDSLIHLEMDQASFYLRFQNVIETKEEDLVTIMAELIVEVLRQDKQEIINELDEVYRVYTSYARCYKLPKEVHIRFACKKVRDTIYKITRDELMTYKGKEIITLKQIQGESENRRDYRFLATLLNK